MFLVQIVLILISTSSAKRLTRVIDGTRVVGRKVPYDAVQYIVGIGTMHGVKWWTLGFPDFLKYLGFYGVLNCGGALLTPSIVQTSCHCVANFDESPTVRGPRINHHWESLRVVYIGINDRFGEPFSMCTRPPVESVKFFVHKACAKLPRASTEGLTHDFGYIKIDPKWISGKTGVPTTRVTFAPIYSVEEMQRIYHTFMVSLPVCLNLGYGNFDAEGNPSDFLRAGWVQLMSEYACEWWTTHELTDAEVMLYFSRVCSQELPAKYKQLTGHGDSGGPFTCNNLYFGIVSSLITFNKGEPTSFRINAYEALIYAMYQNAVEYRAAFEKDVNDWSQDIYVEIVREICKRFCPISFRMRYQQKAGQSSSNKILFPLVLLVLLLNVLLFTCLK